MDLCERTASTQRHPWELSRAKVIEKIIRRSCPADKNIKILDIGCGDGFLLRSLAKTFHASQAIGVDIYLSDEDIRTFSGNGVTLFNNIHQVNASPDIILLLDVIEHVEDDATFLKDLLKRFARPDTVFIITVPAYQPLFSSHDVFLKHYRRYNRRQLKQAITAAGLSMTSGGAMFTSLLAPRILECLKEKLHPSPANAPEGIGAWRQGPRVTGIVQGILDMDNAVNWHLNALGLPLPGLSLWATAKAKP
jgi:trans-aconitate methyltransferase